MSDAGHGGGHGTGHGGKHSGIGKFFGSEVLIGDAGEVLDKTGVGGLLYWVATGNKVQKREHHHHHHHHAHAHEHAHEGHVAEERVNYDSMSIEEIYELREAKHKVWLEKKDILHDLESIGKQETDHYYEQYAGFINCAEAIENATAALYKKMKEQKHELAHEIDTLEEAEKHTLHEIYEVRKEIFTLAKVAGKGPLKPEHKEQYNATIKKLKEKQATQEKLYKEQQEKLHKLYESFNEEERKLTTKVEHHGDQHHPQKHPTREHKPRKRKI